MFDRLAALVRDRPRWILAAWLVVLGVSLPFATRVGEVLTAQPGAPAGSVAQRVRDVVTEGFAEADGYNVVLLARPEGDGRVTDPQLRRSLAAVLDDIADDPAVSRLQDFRTGRGLPFVAADGSYTIALIGLRADGLGEAKEISSELRERFARAEGLVLSLAGGPATIAELERVSKRDALRAELFGLPLSLVILAVAFGALVASALPLLVAIASITLSFAALWWLGQGMEFAVFTQSIVTMLGLATGIDYALLMVNRFREELRVRFDPRAAAYATARTAGKAVAFSGLTVVIALAALLVPPLAFIRSIGIGTMVVLLVSVAVSVTALPALLALLGHRVDWLRVTRREPGMRTRSFWRRRAQRIMARPRTYAILGSLALVVLSLPALRMQVADPGAEGLAPSTEARRVATALDGLGLEGLLGSIDVLIDLGERGFFHPSGIREVSTFGRALQGLDDAETLVGPLTATGVPNLLLYQIYATRESALQSELGDLVRSTVSEDGRYVLLRLLPRSDITPRQGRVLARAAAAAAEEAGVDALVGGAYVQEAEWTATLYDSFPLAIGLVYLATFVLLGLAFRSILIPLKSIVLNTLTVSAAYGVITLVFQEGLLAGPFGHPGGLGFVDNSAPLFIFAIVFGLSMDYEVFLVARIYEAHVRGLDDREAVASSLAATGGVISSAAAVMLAVFAVFLSSEVALIQTLGLGLFVAVLLDATLVRVALVPAVMLLAGRWNWWLPRPVERLANRLDLTHD